jgi:hypothetical protein
MILTEVGYEDMRQWVEQVWIVSNGVLWVIPGCHKLISKPIDITDLGNSIEFFSRPRVLATEGKYWAGWGYVSGEYTKRHEARRAETHYRCTHVSETAGKIKIVKEFDTQPSAGEVTVNCNNI